MKSLFSITESLLPTDEEWKQFREGYNTSKLKAIQAYRKRMTTTDIHGEEHPPTIREAYLAFELCHAQRMYDGALAIAGAIDNGDYIILTD